jgi:hypothetical protein
MVKGDAAGYTRGPIVARLRQLGDDTRKAVGLCLLIPEVSMVWVVQYSRKNSKMLSGLNVVVVVIVAKECKDVPRKHGVLRLNG